MFVLRAALSHPSRLSPEALLAALARRVRPDAFRRMFTRVDFLVGEIDGNDVWLRPVGTRWENPPCELAGVVERREWGSILRGELRLPSRIDRVMVALLPLLALALGIPTAIYDSPAAGLAMVGVMAFMRLVLQAFCLQHRAEILRVVRLAEGAATPGGDPADGEAPGSAPGCRGPG